MTLQQFRDETAHLSGDTEIVWHDGWNAEIEPANLFLFEDIEVGDPLRLKMTPYRILISGIGDEIPAGS